MTFTGTLLPYQNEAVELMVERKRVLVAYDLGLGKTVLTIAAIEHLRAMREIFVPTVLVVCLSSLKYQWAKEIEKFTDSDAMVIDGTKKERAEQWENAYDYHYVICNYEQVVNDWALIDPVIYGGIVMDEATAIKSFKSKRSKKIKELARQIDVRFGLTGTPIENGRPEELFSIMQAIDGKVLGRFDLFDTTFIVRNQWGGIDRYRNLPALHERMKRASVRKSQTDPDVAPYLPDTIEKDPILVPLDRYSAILYRRIVSDLQNDLAEANSRFGSSFSLESHYGMGKSFDPGDPIRGAIMSKVTALRMLADDPKLLVSSAAKFDPMTGEGSQYLSELLEDSYLATTVSKAKGQKVQTLKGLVLDHLDADETYKVVVFTSYVEMADLIRDTVGGVVYTGQMNAREKEAAKVQFQTDPDTRVLISTDAGGYGVDLPQANLLINFDLPWSSGLAIQRNGRIKRASSKWPSIVIQDLLSSETLEERQHAMLRQKRSVAAAVIDGEGINDKGGVDLTVGALSAFLRDVQP